MFLYYLSKYYLVSEKMQEEKLNKEVFSELPGPRGIIVGSLCGSSNQRSAVTCEGDFPFPFQGRDHFCESEVKSQDAGG